jgi:predicted acylesterase/phospholipase RssA
MINCPLYKRFDLVFGTSTGAIIAALIALGYEVNEIHSLYREHVPTVTGARGPEAKSKALETLGQAIFGETKFDAVKTGIGIVATRWIIEKPMIFKGAVAQTPRTGRHVHSWLWLHDL